MKLHLMTNGRAAGLPAFDVPSSVGKSLIELGVAVALNGKKKPQMDYSELFSKWLHGTATEDEKDLLKKFQGSEGHETPVSSTFRNAFITKLKKYVPLLNDESAELGKRTPATIVFTALGTPKSWPIATPEKAAVAGEDSNETIDPQSKFLGAWKYVSGAIRISNDLMNDKAFDLDDWLSSRSAERFGRGLNDVLVNGVKDQFGTQGFPGLLNLTETKPLFYSPAFPQPLAALLQFQQKPFLANTNTLIGLGLQTDPHAVALDTLADGVVVSGKLEHLIIRIVLEMGMLRMTERYAEWGQTAFLMSARWDAVYVGAQNDIQVWGAKSHTTLHLRESQITTAHTT